MSLTIDFDFYMIHDIIILHHQPISSPTVIVEASIIFMMFVVRFDMMLQHPRVYEPEFHLSLDT
jgi:hypothetical protein